MHYEKIDKSAAIDLIENERSNELFFDLNGEWENFDLYAWSFKKNPADSTTPPGISFYNTEFYVKPVKKYFLCAKQLEEGKIYLTLNLETGRLSFQDPPPQHNPDEYKYTFTEDEIDRLPSWCKSLDWILGEKVHPVFL